MADIKFFTNDAGEIIIKLVDNGAELAGLTEIVANTVDAAKEKHVPIIAVDGDVVTVQVGEVEHPMAEDHYIQFIALETSAGLQYAPLKPGDKPVATFALNGAQAVAAYEYCNKHGLWTAQA